MNGPVDEPDRELIDRLIEGIASDEEFARANALLGSNPAARQEFLDKRYLVSALEGPRAAPVVSCVLAPVPVVARRRDRRLLAFAAVAVSVALGSAAFWALSTDGRPDTLGLDALEVVRHDAATVAVPLAEAADHAGVSDAFLAKLVVGDAARFDGPHLPREGAFSRGAYSLAEGAISLRFTNGVELTLESPAAFELIHSKLVILHSGKARARVPQAGIGFVIAAPDAYIEDLGTEFGVVVERGRTTALRVFTGAVELKREGHEPVRIEEDSVGGLGGGDDALLQQADKIQFATTADLAFQKWRAFSEKVRNDPSLVFYYDFEKDPHEPTVLRDRSQAHAALDGVIRGGLWGSGRWPRKGALLLENAGDCVELEIPGEFDAFTQHAWLCLTRIDLRQVILGAHGWTRGKHHWSINSSAEVCAFVGGVKNKRDRLNRQPFGTVPVGQWVQLAAVVDRVAGQSKYYINGVEVASMPMVLDVPLVFGPTLVGAFAQYAEDEWPYDRQLRGRIDELAMFRRALSPEEVHALYVNGRCCD